MSPEPPVAAAVYRGETVESVHRAYVAVCDASGRVLTSVGDPKHVTFTRSSIKAYQLAPLLMSGAGKRFGFDEKQIAVMCSSHSGEPMHIEAVQSVLSRIGLGVDALQCGADAPLDPRAAKALMGEPTAIHHNCSGKHSNMLAQALHLGADPKTYLDLAHPVQTGIRGLIAAALGADAWSIPVGTDGCSAPNFALPIHSAARLFAILARPDRLDPKAADAMRRIRAAMVQHPELVAGTNRFDTHLMRATKGRLACKVGGEGVFGVADTQSGLGLYAKVEDGNGRGVPPVVVSALEALGWLEGADMELLRAHKVVPVRNARGTVVGRIEPRLELPPIGRPPLSAATGI